MKNLPIGNADFADLRDPENNYVYVDKTMHIHRILDDRLKYVFLSRPRRFGKTLLVSTLRALFEGRKELFKGLYIEDKWDFEPYPVIHISFAEADYRIEGELEISLTSILKQEEQRLRLQNVEHLSLRDWLKQLIIEAYYTTGKRVVVLIDEYDKPLLDVLTDKEKLEKHRLLLRGFYSVLKGMESYLRFVFLTGVSKFSQVSIFSGLNNLYDLSFHVDYASICGYTQAELEEHFAEYLVGVDREKLKRWYDGYNFMAPTEQEHVYAPYDILLFFHNKLRSFESYWFDTGTPNFLVNVLQERKEMITLAELENVSIHKTLLSVNNMQSMPLAALFFQTGYLTLKGEQSPYDEMNLLQVGIPNHSVRVALSQQLVRAVMEEKTDEMLSESSSALDKGDLKTVEKNLNSLFAAIPYNNTKLKSYEAYYQSIVFMYFYMMGLHVHAEEHTSEGRIDMSILLKKRVYVCEFKLTARGNDPIQQIRDKGYADKFTTQYECITLVGALCNPQPDKERGEQVVKLVWEEY